VTVKKGAPVGTFAKNTVTCKDAGGASGEFLVTVSPPAVSVQLSGFGALPVTMKVGDTLQLSAAVDPGDALQRVTWSTTSGKTASVSSTGLVTAKKAGTVTITATSADGGKKKAPVRIVITK
jgi:hypothetical protein